jgi:hypothetical protein
MTATKLTPSRLWKRLTSDQRQRAAQAFWSDPEATDDQVQAAFLIAQQKKFRPKTVIGLDIARKAKHLATVAGVSDQIAARALISYHLAEQRPMMGAFLDALGIAHENGLIQEENVKPDAAKINAAVEKISAAFPRADVETYLNTLLCQDPETWGGLEDSVKGFELRADTAT